MEHERYVTDVLQAPALAKQIALALSGVIVTPAWPDRTNVHVCVITVTVQTPLHILFVSGPPQPPPSMLLKQVVPHEADCWGGRISATMCACRGIHAPVCARVSVSKNAGMCTQPNGCVKNAAPT